LLAYLPSVYTVTIECLFKKMQALPANTPLSTTCYTISDTGADPPVEIPLSLQECQQLLALDPFYNALWQGAPLNQSPLNARFTYLQQVTWGAGQETIITLTTAQEQQQSSFYSQAYTVQVQNIFTATQVQTQGQATTVSYTPSSLLGPISGGGPPSTSTSTTTSNQLALTITTTKQGTASSG
jgi:hypothetical protein